MSRFWRLANFQEDLPQLNVRSTLDIEDSATGRDSSIDVLPIAFCLEEQCVAREGLQCIIIYDIYSNQKERSRIDERRASCNRAQLKL